MNFLKAFNSQKFRYYSKASPAEFEELLKAKIKLWNRFFSRYRIVGFIKEGSFTLIRTPQWVLIHKSIYHLKFHGEFYEDDENKGTKVLGEFKVHWVVKLLFVFFSFAGTLFAVATIFESFSINSLFIGISLMATVLLVSFIILRFIKFSKEIFIDTIIKDLQLKKPHSLD